MNTPLPLDAADIKQRRHDSPYLSVEEIDDMLDQCETALTLAARVAELERELAEAKRDRLVRTAVVVCDEMAQVSYDHAKWMAHANALREALQDCFEWFDARADVDHVGDPMRPFPNAEAIQREHVLAALASTPAASLAAHDAEVWERCLSAVRTVGLTRGWHEDRAGFDHGQEWMRKKIENAIRALAAQEVKP